MEPGGVDAVIIRHENSHRRILARCGAKRYVAGVVGTGR